MLKKLRNFLSENSLDYLLINTTDEFLVEYNELSNCARYFVTGFTGSTGDALISQKKLWQFVDGRYHEQADAEVDHKVTTVVKLGLGQTFSGELVNLIEPNSTVGIVSQKISLNFYKLLKTKLSKKHCKIKSFDFEPIEKLQNFDCTDNGEKISPIDTTISGLSADKKFKKISRKIKKNELYLDTHLENIAYLTNCRQYKTPFSATFKAKMILSKAKATIYSNEIFATKIGTYFETKPLKDFDKAFKNAEKVLYNATTINYHDFCLIRKKAQESQKDFIKEMKAIKNDSEIAHFKENFKRTDIVVNKVFEKTQSKKIYSEADLSDFVKKEFLNQGANQLSFKTILASGANSSIIHYSHPSKKVTIKNGEFILLDCGGLFEGGYATDITRTFIKGTPTKEQKQVYTTVLKMFLNVYNYNVTNRTTGFTLDRIARKIHKQSGLNEFNFNHGLGHGVGIGVHESPPTISCNNAGKRTLKENMVFTIEPGLYKAGFGGVRLENTVYLTKKHGKLKIESFSKVPFQENAIDYNLLNKQEKLWLKNWNKKAKEVF